MIDVLVVGGGPVGLAAAIHCTLAGLSVTVAEPRAAPVDKACGEGVMPAAVRRLAALGVTPDGHPLRGIRYLDGALQADAGQGTGTGSASVATCCTPPSPPGPPSSAFRSFRPG